MKNSQDLEGKRIPIEEIERTTTTKESLVIGKCSA